MSLIRCGFCQFSGRNMALKKRATQGDVTFIGAGAERAVDGNTNQDYYADSCSHTDRTDKDRKIQDSWWNVFLGYHVTIWRFRIYNRNDSGKYSTE
jgi:hypothetical protein